MRPDRFTIFADTDLATLAAMGAESSEAFARAFMYEHFFAPMSRQHKRFCAFMDSRERRKKNGISHRGFGKTSLTLMAKCAQHILYDKSRFIVYATNSLDRAIMRSQNLKRELLTNERIRRIWPSIKVSEGADVGMDEEFSKRCWTAFGRTVFVPMGFGQTPRGLLFGRRRPDLIIIDDWQDLTRLHNEEFRQADFERFRGDIEEAVSQYDDEWEIIHTDTCKHQDGLTERLEELPDWATLRLPMAETRDGVLYSLVPELIGHEKIREKYESHKAAGTLDVFYREVLCQPMAEENLVFRREFFKHCPLHDINTQRNLKEMDSIVLVDPARSANPTACESGIIGWTVDRYRPALYCRKALGVREHPDQVMDTAIGMARQIGAWIIGIEVTGLGEFATYPLKTRLANLGEQFKVVELHAKGGVTEPGKIARIKSLIPFYRRGEVYHVEGECDRLEQQLLSFPNAKHWDLMDAAAYIVEVLAQGDAFWLPPEFEGLNFYTASAKEWKDIREEAETEWARDGGIFPCR